MRYTPTIIVTIAAAACALVLSGASAAAKPYDYRFRQPLYSTYRIQIWPQTSEPSYRFGHPTAHRNSYGSSSIFCLPNPLRGGPVYSIHCRDFIRTPTDAYLLDLNYSPKGPRTLAVLVTRVGKPPRYLELHADWLL